MKVSRLDDFSGGMNMEQSKDLLPLNQTPYAKNFVYDEHRGNLVGRKGYLAVNDELVVDNIVNYVTFSLSTGTRYYVMAAVVDEQTKIFVSSIPQMDPAYVLKDAESAGQAADLQLNPNVIPYFCIQGDNLYIFNRGDYAYRWDGDMETLLAVRYNYDDNELEETDYETNEVADELTIKQAFLEENWVRNEGQMDFKVEFSDADDWEFTVDDDSGSENPTFDPDTPADVVISSSAEGNLDNITKITGQKPNRIVPSGRLAVVHHSRMWIISLRGDLSAVHFSEIIDLEGGYIDQESPGAWLGLNKRWCHKDDGDQITGAFVFQRQLYIFKTDKMFKLVGTTPETYQFQLINDKIGCPFHRSIVEVRNQMYWAAMDGIYRFDGARMERVTDRIKELYEKCTTGIRVFSEIIYDTNRNFELYSDKSYNMNVSGNNLSVDPMDAEEFTLTDNGEIDDNRILHEKKQRTVNHGKVATTGSFGGKGETKIRDENFDKPYVRTIELRGEVRNLRGYNVEGRLVRGYQYVELTVYYQEENVSKSQTKGAYVSGKNANKNFTRTFTINGHLTKARLRTWNVHGLYKGRVVYSYCDNVRFHINNQRESYHDRDTETESLATKSADSQFNTLMGRHIEDADVEMEFVNLNPETLEEWEHEELSEVTPYITTGAWDLKTNHGSAGIVYANGGYDLSKSYRPAWWVSSVISRTGYNLGQFTADFVGDCYFWIRSAATMAGVSSATWKTLEHEDQLEEEVDPLVGSDHPYFQIAIVVMVDAKMLGFYVERAQVVGEEQEEIPFSIGAPTTIFAINWDRRYMLILPYESPRNNTAIIINRNDAISVFDNHEFQGMIHDFGDRYFSVGRKR